MPFNIEPLHIGIIAVLIIAGVAWYFARKTKQGDQKIKETIDNIRVGQKEKQDEMAAGDAGLTNALSNDEPEAPVLKPEDEVKADEVQEPVEEPAPVAPEPAPEAVAAAPVHTESGRSAPSIDAAIEAVVYFTPSQGKVFSQEALLKAAQSVQAAENRDLITIDFYDVDSARWYHDVSNVKSCSQIYLSMLLANRAKKVDQLAASIFITLSSQMAIDLNAEANSLDSMTMVNSADQIASIIKAFDNQLTLKVVCAHDIDQKALADAAADCGFVAHEGHFEKSATGSADPVMTITPSKTLPNELDLTLDVALVSPANDPLAQYFSVANDLCCKIDGMITDMQGNPVESASAAVIAQQLKELQVRMAAHGVAAGSNRALRIFSRG